MINIQDLTVLYGEYAAVDGLNLNVQEGELFAFLGPNGAGKTTAIKALTGLIGPDRGSISVGGYDMKEEPIKAKSIMGYVPDVAVFYDKLTSIEFMRFIGDLYGVDRSRLHDNTAELFQKFDLNSFAHSPIEELSHGTCQRLAIAAALVHEPKVFVIDEPMVGLDPLHAKAVKKELRARSDEGVTVLMSTHLLNVAEELADRIGIIDQGKLVALGTLNELREGENCAALEEIFLRLFEGKDSGTS
ncbi:MAG: ABC transporter ATP-binding protein [Verrucomicrobiota bacterium]|nr:ABC transporter ATP-binding protein [Verrucomicrobiota bacterium]MEC8905567.1 ABC transporter ATP-binding protein [Verrucomicrobiota bacterium]MEC9326418.1 ABC transporter ATP-binding protein [Verrucomicrobiota bacterium]MED6300216.1 ABC transporter ATP-binding protein [Verrucomicrobiota bacterium]